MPRRFLGSSPGMPTIVSGCSPTRYADGVEIVTVEALVDGRGIGTALMDAVLAEATARQAPRLWLVTTNDNVRARLLPAMGDGSGPPGP